MLSSSDTLSLDKAKILLSGKGLKDSDGSTKDYLTCFYTFLPHSASNMKTQFLQHFQDKPAFFCVCVYKTSLSKTVRRGEIALSPITSNFSYRGFRGFALKRGNLKHW